MQNLASSADDAATAMAQVGAPTAGGMAQASSGFGGLSNIRGSLSTGGMMALVTALSVGVMALLDHLAVTHDETVSTAQAAAQEFQIAKTNLELLDSQYLANQQRIEELRALQSQGQLTDSQAMELTQLEAQTEAIKTQITAFENLMDLKERKANASGEDYLNKTDTSLASLYDDEGNRYKEGKEADSHAKGATDSDAIQDNITKINEFEKKRDDLLEKQKKASTKGKAESYQEDIDRFQSAIDALEEDMAGRALNLQDILSSMTDTSSEAFQKGLEALDAYNTRSLDSEGWDDRLSEKFTAKEEAEQKAGFGMEGFGAPQQYLDIEDTVTGLREQLEQTFDEDERIKISMEIDNLTDVQTGLLEGFSELHPEGFDTADEYTQAWQDYMDTISTEDLVANLDINDEEAIKKMEEIFGLEENTLSFIMEARDHASESIIAVSEMKMKDIKKETGIYRKCIPSDRYLSLFNRDSLLIRNPLTIICSTCIAFSMQPERRISIE